MTMNPRLWRFVGDMNFDGVVTISDIWAWFKWLYFYPGDGLIYLIIYFTPNLATFLEIDYRNYGGIFSGLISFVIWVILFSFIGLAFSILDTLSSGRKPKSPFGDPWKNGNYKPPKFGNPA